MYAAPWRMMPMASVVMIGGMRMKTINSPFAAPTMRETAMTVTTVRKMVSLPPIIIRAAMTLVRVMSDVTDRSIPPISRAMVCPMATRPSGAAWRMISSRFAGSRDRGATMPRAASRRSRKTTMKSCCTIRGMLRLSDLSSMPLPRLSHERDHKGPKEDESLCHVLEIGADVKEIQKVVRQNENDRSRQAAHDGADPPKEGGAAYDGSRDRIHDVRPADQRVA